MTSLSAPARRALLSGRVFRYEILLLLLVAAAHLPLMFLPVNSLMKWYYTDDAFYYFQVARNISLGNGLTFDGISLTSGFHPLWMLVCIPVFSLAKIDPVLPLRLLVLISTALTFSGGVLLYRMIRQVYSIQAAVLGSLLWVFYWPLHQVVTQSGMEAGLNGFLIILLLHTTAKFHHSRQTGLRSLLATGILAAFVLLSRLDNIFLVFLMGIWLVFRQTHMRLLILADAITVFFAVYAGFILRFGVAASLPYRNAAFVMIAAGIVVRLVLNYVCGLYGNAPEMRFRGLLVRSLVSVSAGAAVLFVLLQLLSVAGIVAGFPRSVLVADWGITLVVLIATRWVAGITRRPDDRPNTLEPEHPIIWFRRGLAYFLPLLLIFSVYLVWHWSIFDTPLPVSGQIKQWWGTLPHTIYGRPAGSLWEALDLRFGLCGGAAGGMPWQAAGTTVLFPVLLLNRLLAGLIPGGCGVHSAAILLIYLAGIAWVVWRQRAIAAAGAAAFSLPVLIGTGLLQPFFYQANGYLHTREWYWLTQALAAILVTVTILACLQQAVRGRRTLERAFSIGVVILILAVPVSFLGNLAAVFTPVETSPNAFDPSIAFLEAQTEPGARIGMTGGGVTAYFLSGRTIVNLDGLMNSTDYFSLMREGRAQEYLDQISLDYVFGSETTLLNSDPYRWFFTDRLEVIEHFGADTLYRWR